MNVSDIAKGKFIRYKHGIWVVTDFQHVFPGKGNAFVRTKLKNLESGKALENTFKIVEKLEEADVEYSDAQYLYNDGSIYVFMDNETYDQFEIEKEKIEDIIGYLVEEQKVLLIKLDGQPLTISVPKKIQLKVTDAPPGVKGDSATGATKIVTLETGMTITTPLFIKEGDTVAINTETGDYTERISK